MGRIWRLVLTFTAFAVLSSVSSLGRADAEDPVFEAEVASVQQVTQQQATAIKASRATYSGKCPCPYDRDSAGRLCGKRSAYSRAGGASALCYPSDVQ
jgi:hypothetical protein